MKKIIAMLLALVMVLAFAACAPADSGETTKAPDGGEVVTCGGIKNSEVDFSTMQSKIAKGLFFAGECLDIDGLTGGFNLQNAWCTAKIAAAAISQTP